MFLSRAVPFALVIAAGCASRGADVFRIDNAVRPQTHPDSIRFLAEEPKQPYTVIALVNGWNVTRGFLITFYRKSARRSLAEAAAQLGGDAVLLSANSLTRGGADTKWGSTFAQVSGKVIVFNREARSN
jgi:hypothetical protein